MLSTKVIRRGAVLLALGGVVMLALRRERQAKADPGTPGIDPRLWAQQDLRRASSAEIVPLAVKFSLLCGVDPGKTAAGLLAETANRSILSGAEALLLSCVAGAPTQATCAQLQQCTGMNEADPGPEVPQCDGALLRSRVHRGGSTQTNLSTTSCQAQGESCYQGPIGGLCGVGTCNDTAPYRCDGDAIVACVEGIQQRTLCGRGMTCGESPGSHALDCIGKGKACTGGARCDGTTLQLCQRDSWGKGFEQALPCADFGLTCQQATNDKAQTHAVCVPPKDGDCTAGSASCDGVKLSLCVLNKKTTLGCSDIGLGGSCSMVDGKAACK
jgi:hypothetical protein